MKMLAVILVLGSMFTWALAVGSWFLHDDHAAIGWLMAFFIVGAYANYVLRRVMIRRIY